MPSYLIDIKIWLYDDDNNTNQASPDEVWIKRKLFVPRSKKVLARFMTQNWSFNQQTYLFESIIVHKITQFYQLYFCEEYRFENNEIH